ncbi:MAG: rhodanese-like domain-containing protein [Pyrinomonadaceae bacterium]
MRHLINTSAATLLAVVALAAGAAGQQINVPVTVPPPAQTQGPGDGARRITPAEARVALDNGEAIIVDVRGDASYEAGHVAGARLIPFSDVLARIDEFPRNKLIITYCS